MTRAVLAEDLPQPETASAAKHRLFVSLRERALHGVYGARAAVRLARVGLHLAWGMSSVAVAYPLLNRRARAWLKRRWSRQLLDIIGLRCEFSGFPASQGPNLLVANHVSWLDIFVINALLPAAFVCKSEVREWPAIGWLCAHTETVFLPRGSRSAARATAALIAQRLAQGWAVGVFPEGTTSDGSGLLPFHAALLQGALDAASPVQALALRYYGQDGARSEAPVYCGTTSLLESLWRTLGATELTVRVEVLPVVRGAADRRELSDRLRQNIAAALSSEHAAGQQEWSGSAAAAPTV